MDIEALRQQKLIVLECISGSKAYGLDTPQSDLDIKGIFIAQRWNFYGLDYIAQVSNASNDIAFFELKRMMELLLRNNPTILELIFTPPPMILYQHPVMKMLDPSLFLSKKCDAHLPSSEYGGRNWRTRQIASGATGSRIFIRNQIR